MNGPCWRYLTCPPWFARGFCYAEHCQGSWWSVCLFCPTFRGDLVSSQLSAKTKKKVIHKLRWQARQRRRGGGGGIVGFFYLPNLSDSLMYNVLKLISQKISTQGFTKIRTFAKLGSKLNYRRLWMPQNTKEEKSFFLFFSYFWVC